MTSPADEWPYVVRATVQGHLVGMQGEILYLVPPRPYVQDRPVEQQLAGQQQWQLSLMRGRRGSQLLRVTGCMGHSPAMLGSNVVVRDAVMAPRSHSNSYSVLGIECRPREGVGKCGAMLDDGEWVEVPVNKPGVRGRAKKGKAIVWRPQAPTDDCITLLRPAVMSLQSAATQKHGQSVNVVAISGETLQLGELLLVLHSPQGVGWLRNCAQLLATTGARRYGHCYFWNS